MIISKKSVIEVLKFAPNVAWMNYAKDGLSFKWIPLLTNDEFGTNFLGLSEEGVWVYGTERGLRMLDSVDNCFFILPAMNLGKKSFVSMLLSSVVAANLPEVLVKTFPFDNMVLSAIQNGPHFVSMALEWFENGYPMNDTICAALLSRGLSFPCVKRYEEERLKQIMEG